MKLLFGVQATGNGHLSRAREMAKHFRQRGTHVDFLISGREKEQLHDMEVFGDYRWRKGLTFQTENGQLKPIKTALNLHLRQFFKDIKQLDVASYDLVLSDYEPISAWAAKLKGKTCIGVGHQYAFSGLTPRVKGKWVSSMLLSRFAPANENVGLHWHNFNGLILPPIIDPLLQIHRKQSNKVVVYLPFENQQMVSKALQQVTGFEFYQYGPGLQHQDLGHLHLRKPSVVGFHQDLENCGGVICNTGFELISECLQLGTPVLSTPLEGQIEQLSNAVALNQLQLATIIDRLTPEAITEWLHNKHNRLSANYPDVASAIVDWIIEGRKVPLTELAEQLWNDCRDADQLVNDQTLHEDASLKPHSQKSSIEPVTEDA